MTGIVLFVFVVIVAAVLFAYLPKSLELDPQIWNIAKIAVVLALLFWLFLIISARIHG